LLTTVDRLTACQDRHQLLITSYTQEKCA